MNSRHKIKKNAYLEVISEWIDPGSHVVDLGCGQGILLESLIHKRKVSGFGVDIELDKITSCTQRGVPAYQGDIRELLEKFPKGFFDWVICSRTIQDIEEPNKVLSEALRVGKQVAIGFVNSAFWINRFHLLFRGQRVQNEVYPKNWAQSRPSNPISVKEFENFCRENQVEVIHRRFLRADWVKTTSFLPNWTAGFALYHISSKN